MTSPQSVPDYPVLRRVYEDFEEGDPIRVACFNIVQFIAENEAKSLNYLTFGMLLSAAKLDETQGDTLHRAIAYLTGTRAKLLLIGYQFIQDDYEHVLDEEEIDIFLSENVFCDPRTGRAVDDCANHIYVFFRPNYAAFH